MHCKLDVLLSVFQQSIHVIRENGGCKHALKSIARQQKRTLRERKKKNRLLRLTKSRIMFVEKEDAGEIESDETLKNISVCPLPENP